MKEKIAGQLGPILAAYDPTAPRITADDLRNLWLQFEPKSMDAIKAELRERQETVGIPVPVLQAIGKGLSRAAPERVDEFIPLAQVLWDEYGREGRVVGVIALGAMELVDPEKVMPMLRDMCRTCITWEDADRLAMNALEPIVRKDPERWLSAIEPWLEDENKWVRRAGVTVAGRLPMRHPATTTHCLELARRLLFDEEVDVKKAVSFAIRLSARGEPGPVRDFLGRHVPPENPAATWVLSDAIRSMAKLLLPEFTVLLPLYEAWASDPSLSARDRRSVESAVKTLHKAQG
ncbi:MAG: DNA alkylation repair protein [Anaerolineae bacterium]|nr:DNA alkylation repair protein [Anaerolineae bacterium]